jgi:hypothetical protein
MLAAKKLLTAAKGTEKERSDAPPKQQTRVHVQITRVQYFQGSRKCGKEAEALQVMAV